jgi:hypothetical protein
METLKMTANKQELTLLKLISICLILEALMLIAFRMYFGYYNVIPNYKSIDYIDINAFMKWFEKV